MGASDEIIALAKRSGIPFKVGSTYRPGATTLSGNVSWHASDNAVDFMGYNQDALAQYFMSLPTHEVIHHSNKTGKSYATSEGRPYTLQGALLEQHRNHLHVAANEAKARNALGSAGVASGIDPTDPAGTIKTLIGFIPNPANVTDALANIGNALTTSAMNVSRVADFGTKLFLPTTGIRVASFLFGTIFVVVGVWFLAREIKESGP